MMPDQCLSGERLQESKFAPSLKLDWPPLLEQLAERFLFFILYLRVLSCSESRLLL